MYTEIFFVPSEKIAADYNTKWSMHKEFDNDKAALEIRKHELKTRTKEDEEEMGDSKK